MLKPLYVITALFNPRRFKSRYELYRLFEQWVRKADVRLITVEVAFGRRPHLWTEAGDPYDVQLRTWDEMWHKERALNLGVQRLCQIDPGWEYVAWMDCDIKLSRDDWAMEAPHLLQHYAVIQMFGEAHNLNPDQHISFASRSIMRNYATDGNIGWSKSPGLVKPTDYAKGGHPGLAWAFRREELARVGGWLDTCVNGSGDLHMACCYAGQGDLAIPTQVSDGYKNVITRYAARCEKYVKRNVGFMPGTAQHYWHGKSRERGYDSRWWLLVKHKFDPYEDLITNDDGLYKWAGNKKQMEYDIRASLAQRNEDSIDP